MEQREGTQSDTPEERPEGRKGYFTRQGCFWGCIIIAIATVLFWVIATIIIFDADSLPPPG
ncbi:MAG: hypothetical protein JXA57_09060 [Armatimonadetes bacterium]|nr:hypothetical protein [Armatimonadota bacterium]